MYVTASVGAGRLGQGYCCLGAAAGAWHDWYRLAITAWQSRIDDGQMKPISTTCDPVIQLSSPAAPFFSVSPLPPPVPPFFVSSGCQFAQP